VFYAVQTETLTDHELTIGVTSEDEISGPKASLIVPDFITPALGDFVAGVNETKT